MSLIINQIDLLDIVAADVDRERGHIFDPVRKKLVHSLPEELVRQAMIRALNKYYDIPYSRMAIERKIIIHNEPKRFDIVVYNSSGAAHILIECKAYYIPVQQSIFDQAAQYNFLLKAPYLCITNGSVIKLAHIDFIENKISFIEKFPMYPF